MKQEFKTLLLLVMLTFLSVNCGSNSNSSSGDDLPEFSRSEGISASDGLSVFERLVQHNEHGKAVLEDRQNERLLTQNTDEDSESEPASDDNGDDNDNTDDSAESESDKYLTIEELEAKRAAEGKTMVCIENCD